MQALEEPLGGRSNLATLQMETSFSYLADAAPGGANTQTGATDGALRQPRRKKRSRSMETGDEEVKLTKKCCVDEPVGFAPLPAAVKDSDAKDFGVVHGIEESDALDFSVAMDLGVVHGIEEIDAMNFSADDWMASINNSRNGEVTVVAELTIAENKTSNAEKVVNLSEAPVRTSPAAPATSREFSQFSGFAPLRTAAADPRHTSSAAGLHNGLLQSFSPHSAGAMPSLARGTLQHSADRSHSMGQGMRGPFAKLSESPVLDTPLLDTKRETISLWLTHMAQQQPKAQQGSVIFNPEMMAAFTYCGGDALANLIVRGVRSDFVL